MQGALIRALQGVDIRIAVGCGVTGDDRSGFEAAVEAAAVSDVAVLVLGERSGLTEDCTTGESRDVASLRLPGVQEELVHAVAATGHTDRARTARRSPDRVAGRPRGGVGRAHGLVAR